MPSDTYFTVPPDWTWYIIPYFFIGGIAGGSYFIAVLLDWLWAYVTFQRGARLITGS